MNYKTKEDRAFLLHCATQPEMAWRAGSEGDISALEDIAAQKVAALDRVFDEVFSRAYDLREILEMLDEVKEDRELEKTSHSRVFEIGYKPDVDPQLVTPPYIDADTAVGAVLKFLAFKADEVGEVIAFQ